jgi:hypothetical protein
MIIYAYLLKACGKASRIIKCVVVMSPGYSSNPLLDMRIHDITVVADPNRRLPAAPEPEEADGTTEGTSTSDERTAADVDLSQAMQPVTTYWTGWWPTLHILINWQFSADVYVSLHFIVDLLYGLQLVPEGSFSVLTPMLALNGYTGQAASDKIVLTINKAASDTEIGNAWSRVDEALIVCTLLGLGAGIHPVATALYIVSYGYLIYTIINAILTEHAKIQSGSKDRVEAGIDIFYKGFVQFMCGGSADLLEGMFFFFDLAEKEFATHVATLYGSRVQWSRLHDISFGGMVAGIALIALGFAMMIYGYLLAVGVIPS